MNPVFWLIVIVAAVALWFFLRRIFVWLGSRADGLLKDTKKILKSNGGTKK